VWHVTVGAAPEDPVLGDGDRMAIAAELMHRSGLSAHEHEHEGVPWVAVHHDQEVRKPEPNQVPTPPAFARPSATSSDFCSAPTCGNQTQTDLPQMNADHPTSSTSATGHDGATATSKEPTTSTTRDNISEIIKCG
jgi:hypothetical protein